MVTATRQTIESRSYSNIFWI